MTKCTFCIRIQFIICAQTHSFMQCTLHISAYYTHLATLPFHIATVLSYTKYTLPARPTMPYPWLQCHPTLGYTTKKADDAFSRSYNDIVHLVDNTKEAANAFTHGYTAIAHGLEHHQWLQCPSLNQAANAFSSYSQCFSCLNIIFLVLPQSGGEY